MRQNPAALVAFSISFGTVVIGGSALTFASREERSRFSPEPKRRRGRSNVLHSALAALRRAAVVSIEAYLDGCRRLWRRYVTLGMCLLVTYARDRARLSGLIVSGYALVDNIGMLFSWTVGAAIGSSVLIVWISVAELLLSPDADGHRRRRRQREEGILGAVGFVRAQLARDCRCIRRGPAAGGHRDGRRRSWRRRGSALIAFVPLVGLAVVPLQVAAWLLRGFVFQYLGADRARRLSATRHDTAGLSPQRTSWRINPGQGALKIRRSARQRSTTRMTDYTRFLSRAAGHMQESAIRRMGMVLAQGRDIISFAPGYPAPETFPWKEFQRHAERAAVGRGWGVLQYGPDARLPPAARNHRRHHGAPRRRARRCEQLLVTTGSQQGLDLVARVLLDPGDIVLVELPTYTGAITAFRNVQARMVGVRQEADGIDLDDSRRRLAAADARRRSRAAALRRAELPESDRAADRPREAATAARVGGAAATC